MTIKNKISTKKTTDFNSVMLPDLSKKLFSQEKKEDSLPEIKKEIPSSVQKNKITKTKSNNVQSNTITLRIGKKLHVEFHELSSEIYFKNKLLAEKQSFIYILHIALQNMKENYLEKYEKLQTPDDFYLTFYSKRQTKGYLLPPNIDLENPVTIGIQISESDKELYSQLMHTYFVNELSQRRGIRYSVSMFFYQIMKFLKENIDNLKMYD